MRLTRTFLKSTSAAVMPIFALLLSTIILIVAVSLAIASDSKAVNEIQATADAAAVAGATAFVSLDSPKVEVRLAAAKEEAVNFAVANSDYTITDLDIDAVSEDAYGQATNIHVEMEFQPANVMARVAGRSGNMAIRRRATASAVWGFPLCTLALSETGTGVRTAGSAQYIAQNCIVWSNATSRASMDFQGGTARAQSFCAAGLVSGGTRALPYPEQNCDIIPDPLKNWSPPGPGECIEITGRDEIADSRDTKDQIKILKILQNTLDVLAEGSNTRPREDDDDDDDDNNENPASLAGIYPNIDTSPIESALDDGEPLPADLSNQIMDTLTSATNNGDLISVGKGNDELGPDGRYTKSDAEGMTPLDVAEEIGLIDESDPSSYADDTYSDNVTYTLSPGTYCGLDIKKDHVKMLPGVYHIKDAPLKVRKRATLTGDGVTIVLSGERATFNIIDEARLTLTAPITGETAGFALAEDKRVNYDGSKAPRSRLAGDGIVDAIGTIYLPRHDFEISGNGSGQQASPLLQIVANTVQLEENGQLRIVFDPSKTEVPVGIKPARTARLVN